MVDESHEALPAELEYLRPVALELVGPDREIVGCGQVDYSRLERALREAFRGLSPVAARQRREDHSTLLRRWLATQKKSNEPLVIGLRFVAMLLSEQL
jgi:hypothetical protein